MQVKPDAVEGSRRVLIVAYHFPPDASIGMLRTLKFVRYIEEWGWQAVVLTVCPSRERFSPQDASMLKEVPSRTVVLRTWA